MTTTFSAAGSEVLAPYVAAAYPSATYERLAALKRRYDLANFFRRNHNIRPA